jgi:3-oxoadipate enol-lactonase
MATQRATLTTGISMEHVFTRSTSERPVVCFIHGLGANMSQFADQLDFFREHYDVLLLSLRGHGGSSGPRPARPEDFTVEAYASDVRALAEQLGIEEMHVVGNSLGGMVGYELLRSRSPRLASLTTFGTVAKLSSPRLLLWWVEATTRLLSPAAIAWMVAVASARSARVKERLRAMYRGTPKETMLLTSRNIWRFDYTAVLRELDIPYLLVRCDLDRQIVNDQLAATLEAIADNPGAEVKDLTGGGHFANLDQPEAFNDILGSFLARLADTASGRASAA